MGKKIFLPQARHEISDKKAWNCRRQRIAETGICSVTLHDRRPITMGAQYFTAHQSLFFQGELAAPATHHAPAPSIATNQTLEIKSCTFTQMGAEWMHLARSHYGELIGRDGTEEKWRTYRDSRNG
jgi:hypothetical protein